MLEGNFGQPQVLRGEQRADGPPIVENAALPRMGQAGIIGPAGPQLFMETNPGTERRMEPLPTSADGRISLTSLPEGRPIPAAPAPEEPRTKYPDQQRRPSAMQPTESYVRLQVHAEDGKLTVTDVKEVPGPLVLPDTVAAGLAYEARIDDTRVGLESIPDANIIRSFPNPGVPGQEGHKFFRVPSFDFYVRVPRSEITPQLLSRLTIALYQVHQQPNAPIGPQQLLAHPALELTEIARLHGIAPEQLSQPARAGLERVLRSPI
jgi:hypothetical protein